MLLSKSWGSTNPVKKIDCITNCVGWLVLLDEMMLTKIWCPVRFVLILILFYIYNK